MKILLTLFLLATVSAATAQQTTLKEKIRHLQSSYDKAVVQKDSVFLKTLFHDDMIITGGDGTRRNKKAEISDCIDPRYNTVHFATTSIEVDIFGTTTAVLRGDLEWQVKNSDGNGYTMKKRVTFVYAKFNDQWKIVSQHIGQAPKTLQN